MSKKTENNLKISFEDSLEEVVLTGKCTGCAACSVVCPLRSLNYLEGKPRLVDECTACGICAGVCPRYSFSWPDVERSVFGRERTQDEHFGIHRRMVVAQARDKTIRRVSQDGGLVTALIMFALENGLIDGAIVSGVDADRPFYPVPRLATTPQKVLECAGTRYSYSPNFLAFQEGIKQKLRSLAFVGTPCQIQALRRIEMFPLKKYANSLKLTIGLMCTECFTYKGLIEKYLQNELGINPRDIIKINIKGRVLVTTKSGEIETIPLKKAKEYTNPSCTLCSDFSAELADISAGGLGLSGWTFTILRTQRGEELFERAVEKEQISTRPIEEEKRALELMIRLSQRKREAALNFSREP